MVGTEDSPPRREHFALQRLGGGGVDAEDVARWNGSTWRAIRGGTNGVVRALTAFRNEFHAGGDFTAVRNAGVPSEAYARFSEDGVPWIVEEPEPHAANCGDNVVFRSNITQGCGAEYQWRRDSLPLVAGPTGTGSTIELDRNTLRIGDVTTGDAGSYDCVVSNTCGSIATAAVALTIVECVVRGDLNCDGRVNNFDIDAFVLALSDRAAYAALYPQCSIAAADINGDGAVNNFDIDPFVEYLSEGGRP